MAVSAAEWTPHSCDKCINLDPIKVGILQYKPLANSRV